VVYIFYLLGSIGDISGAAVEAKHYQRIISNLILCVLLVILYCYCAPPVESKFLQILLSFVVLQKTRLFVCNACCV
jgi:hypothetical protein